MTENALLNDRYQLQETLGSGGMANVYLARDVVRTSQAVSSALSFFWLDGFAVPTPARVPTGQAAIRWLALSFYN